MYIIRHQKSIWIEEKRTIYF